MPVRLTVADVRLSRFSTVAGLCSNNLAEIIPALNECVQRLIYAMGDTPYAKAAFTVYPDHPYITLPRQFARMINMDVCRTPVRIHNAFWEFLPGGVGLQDVTTNRADWCGTVAGYERQSVPTMRDIDPTNQLVRVYASNTKDYGKQVMITGLDQNGLQIYTQGTNLPINGTLLVMAAPFVTTKFSVSLIQALQKDVTSGDVIIKQVDATSGVEIELARLAPTETNPSYRRYFIHKLPTGCCCPTGGFSTVTGLVKLEYVPVYQDSDQVLINNLSALIEEVQALRYSSMDIVNAAALEQKHHAKAIKLLQNEQRHLHGVQSPAVVVNSMEGMGLQRNAIGYLT